jgi:transcriptional regulator with XRE-family HTH domain
MMSQQAPYYDIGQRILWHRNFVGMTQSEYAVHIGAGRSALSNWEAGIQRLSLDGGLKLREKFGLPLDFLFCGDADALPKTLRFAWTESISETAR